MPTPNQEAQLRYSQLQQARQQGEGMAPQVSGYPVNSPEEGQQVAEITRDVSLPGPVNTVGTMIRDSPWLLTTAAGEAAGAAAMGGATKTPAAAARGAKIGGALAQVPYTLASRAITGGEGTSFMGDLARNETAYGTGTVIGAGLSKGINWLAETKPAQAVAKYVAGKVLGKVTPDAASHLQFADEMVNDLANAVNAVRGRNGKPLYSRQEIEKQMDEHLAELQKNGLLNLTDVTTGSTPAAAEALTGGSLAAKGTFGRKQAAADAGMEAWPKLWAAMLGREAGSPDELAVTTGWMVDSALRAKAATAGAKMGAVEQEVGDRTIDIGEELVQPLERQVALYSKLHGGPSEASIRLDPEGIDAHLKAAIGLVEKSTGKKFNAQSGAFEDVLDPALAGQPQAVVDAMRAQGVLPQPSRTQFSFSDIKTLNSFLSQIQARLPEGEKNQANAVLSTLHTTLKGKLDNALSAMDALRGMNPLDPRSLTKRWQAASQEYGAAMDARAGFPAQTWLEALRESGSGKAVLKQVWPDNADIGRVTALKQLMGGGEYWKELQRFKAEQFVADNASDPRKLHAVLTSNENSRAYWEEAFGKQQYDRLLKYAELAKARTRTNPFASEAGLARRQEAGMTMAAGPMQGTTAGRALTGAAVGGAGAVTGAGLLGTVGALGGGVLSFGGYVATVRQVAKWLVNTKDAEMLLGVMGKKTIGMKERAWLRNAYGRAAADAAVNEQPEMYPIPKTATLEELRGQGQPQSPASYGGIRG